MVPNRSILLVTVPSLVLICGFVWLRRKKSGVHCDTGGKNNNNKSRLKSEKEQEEEISDKNSNKHTFLFSTPTQPLETSDLKRSQSLPCAASTPVSRDSIDRQTGKSAPIDIAPNPRSPPKKLTEKQIDSELLKFKLEESDSKNLLAIEEQSDDDFSMDSPADLPGSVERRHFSMQQRSNMNKEEEPVVVKATVPPKVSPKGSFEEVNCMGERDSANQSPVDNKNQEEIEEITRNDPIASPPLSVCSVHSGDSGKGSSPPHSEGGVLSSVYDFVVPVHLVQHLIGKKGRYVKQLKAKTGVNMIVNEHPTSHKLRICSLEGTQKEIEAALKVLRVKLPEKRYPQVTLERVFFNEPNCVIPLPAIDTSCLQVRNNFPFFFTHFILAFNFKVKLAFIKVKIKLRKKKRKQNKYSDRVDFLLNSSS